jgi:muconolactone delta-isomerase
MSQFMVEFILPDEMTEEFVAKIPRQRLKINELMEKGKITAYSLSADRTKLWCVLKADTEFDVMEIISEFPLIDFMRPTITELMFNNTATAVKLPMFSLN